MSNEEITNLLLVCVVIAWYAKIWFHFRYIKLIDERLKNANVITFLINPINIFSIIVVVLPVFFSGNHRQDMVKEKRMVWVGTCLLWLTLGISFFFLYNLSPRTSVQNLKYDLTNPH